jgi:transcription initiation factor TFIIB
MCPECWCTEIIRDPEAGELVCGGCGLVLGNIPPDPRPEWKAFNPGEWEDRPRAAPVKGPGNATLVGKDTYGVRLTREKEAQIIRMRRWHRRLGVNTGRDRNLRIALPELHRLVGELHLPTVTRLEAEKIYRQALDRGLVRGRSIDDIAAACVYAACRLTGVPRSLAMICEHTSASRRDVARGYRLIHIELGLDVPLPDPRTRVYRIGTAAGASEKAKQHAVNILSAARRNKATAGKDPAGLAAAALYLACRLYGEKITQKSIADAAGVTDVTIRNRYKDLEKYVEEAA